MKKLLKVTVVLMLTLVASCTTVDSGHKGVKVSWGGKTDMDKIYNEGMHSGLGWVWNDMIEYDVREQTYLKHFEFNDNNNMITKVAIALDYRVNPTKVNLLHTRINDVSTKIYKTLKSACKEVVPQYSAVDLNIAKRTEAENKLKEIIEEELPKFYLEFISIQVTDVDIPKAVSTLAEETAVQLGRNELAKKKEAEQVALAKAKVAEAQGNYNAGVLDAKTKKLLSTPEILKLKELEVEMEFAKQGKSRYGTNNVFGSETAVLKGLK